MRASTGDPPGLNPETREKDSDSLWDLFRLRLFFFLATALYILACFPLFPLLVEPDNQLPCLFFLWLGLMALLSLVYLANERL